MTGASARSSVGIARCTHAGLTAQGFTARGAWVLGFTVRFLCLLYHLTFPRILRAAGV